MRFNRFDDALRAAYLILFALSLGCSNHELLAEKGGPAPPDSAVSDAPSSNDSFPTPPRDARPPIDAGDPEPPGPWRLTWVNGIVDLGAVRLCWVPVLDGGEAPGDEPPVPPAPGLSFGAKLVVGAPPADFAAVEVHPYLIARAEGTSGSLTCRQILASAGEAGPNGPTAISLPTIPAGTLAPSRSYLAVTTGCAFGVPLPDGPDAGDAGSLGSAKGPLCGSSLDRANAALTVVRPSRRTAFDKVGFQATNGSGAASPVSLLIDQPTGGLSVFFSDTLETGQIAPRNQPGFVSKSDLGISVGSARISVLSPFMAFPPFETKLADVLATSGLAESDLAESTGFTFVTLGSLPGRDAGAWHSFRILLVSNAPDVSGGD